MHNYKKLEIYKEAFELTKEIYDLTSQWPQEEQYVLIPQIRRSAHSVNSNICEGASRISDSDCLRFIYNAYASLQETENHLTLAHTLGYLGKANFQVFSKKIDRLSRMIYTFIQHLKELKNNPAA